MTNRTKFAGVVAMTIASSLTLNVFAQDSARQGTDPAGTSQAGQPGSSQSGVGQSGASQTGSTGQSGSTSGGAGAMQGSAGQVGQGGGDSQIRQALTQISQSPENAPEKLFVLAASMGNAWETEFSRVVSQRVQDPQIKQLAQMIQQDHQQAQQRLQLVAQRLGIELPTSLPSDKQQKLQIFQSMSPEELQTCYVVDLKADHAMAISSYSDHQKTLKDEQVKQYIAEALPKLQQHGTHVQQIAMSKQIGDPNSAMMGSADQQQNREVQRRNGGGMGAPGDTGAGGSGASGASGSGSGSGTSGTSGSGTSGSGSGTGSTSGSGSGTGTSGSGTSGSGSGAGSTSGSGSSTGGSGAAGSGSGGTGGGSPR